MHRFLRYLINIEFQNSKDFKRKDNDWNFPAKNIAEMIPNFKDIKFANYPERKTRTYFLAGAVIVSAAFIDRSNILPFIAYYGNRLSAILKLGVLPDCEDSF